MRLPPFHPQPKAGSDSLKQRLAYTKKNVLLRI